MLPFLHHYCCSVCTNRAGSKKGEWLWTQLMSKYWFFPYLSFGLCPYFLLFCLHHQMFLTSYSIHVLHQIKLLFSSTSTGEQIVEIQAINLKILVASWVVTITEALCCQNEVLFKSFGSGCTLWYSIGLRKLWKRSLWSQGYSWLVEMFQKKLYSR